MSMTTEQAAAWFENRFRDTPMPGARAMFEIAAAALREKAEREDPQPLTENDLLHMHGQPVYVAERRAYGIVSVAYGAPFVDMLDFSSIGGRCPGYHFYRHKPQEVQG